MPTPRATHRDITRRFWWWLALITIAGLALRIVYVLVWRADAFIGGDSQFYHDAANLLADGRGFINPFFSTPEVAVESADHPPLYWVYLGSLSWLGFDTPLWHMLWSTLLGAGTVFAAGLAGREIAGPRAGLIGAAGVALYANVWSWDGMLLSEAAALTTVTLTLWAAYRYWHQPSVGNVVLLGAMTGLATLARAELILLSVLVVLPLVMITGSEAFRARIGRLAIAALAVVVLVGPWVAFNMSRFEKPVLLSTGFEITLLSATCDDTYGGALVGYWSFNCAQPVREELDATNPGLDQSEEAPFFREAALDYIDEHRDQVPGVVLARWGRVTHLFRPWQQSQLDVIPESREQWIARAGLFGFYALLPFAIAGGFALRGRRVPVFPLLGPIVAVWITVTIAFATTRYRAAAETALVLLAAVAVDALIARWRSRSPAGAAP